MTDAFPFIAEISPPMELKQATAILKKNKRKKVEYLYSKKMINQKRHAELTVDEGLKSIYEHLRDEEKLTDPTITHQDFVNATCEWEGLRTYVQSYPSKHKSYLDTIIYFTSFDDRKYLITYSDDAEKLKPYLDKMEQEKKDKKEKEEQEQQERRKEIISKVAETLKNNIAINRHLQDCPDDGSECDCDCECFCLPENSENEYKCKSNIRVNLDNEAIKEVLDLTKDINNSAVDKFRARYFDIYEAMFPKLVVVQEED